MTGPTHPLNTDLTHKHHQLKLSFVVLVMLLVGGASGFLLLGDQRSLFESVYLTVVILTTVGMKEGGLQLTRGEQAWALVLMMTGISAVLYVGSILVAFFIDGDLRRLLGKRQLQKKISHLHNHIVVCGFGRMGRALCERLTEKEVPFVLIEDDPQRTAIADELGYLYLLGDAMSQQVLEQARVDRARGLASCLRSDADNVFVTLTARSLNEKLTIISRAEKPDTESKLLRAGANRVVCTPVIGANRVTYMLLHPGIDELLELAVHGPDLEISKVCLTQLPGAVGRSLRELSLPAQAGLMVVAVIHADGTREFNPPPDSQLQTNDEVIVIGPQGGVDKMFKMLGGSS